MPFEWDERRNRNNIRKHGLNFADAESVFDAPMLVDLDVRLEYGEDRWIGLGLPQRARHCRRLHRAQS